MVCWTQGDAANADAVEHAAFRFCDDAKGSDGPRCRLALFAARKRMLGTGEGAAADFAQPGEQGGTFQAGEGDCCAVAGDHRPRLGWPPAGQPASTTGAAQAIGGSLQAAALTPAELDFIVGGGNGTALDALETQALRQALGAAAERVPIASVLGQCGEWLTSAGARLGAALYALHEQALPGTTLCSEPDPAAALPGLVLTPRPATAPLRHVLVPVLAQGGGNAAIILSQAEPD